MMGHPARAGGRAASRYFRRRDFYAQAATAVGHSGFTFLSGPEGTEECSAEMRFHDKLALRNPVD